MTDREIITVLTIALEKVLRDRAAKAPIKVTASDVEAMIVRGLSWPIGIRKKMDAREMSDVYEVGLRSAMRAPWADEKPRTVYLSAGKALSKMQNASGHLVDQDEQPPDTMGRLFDFRNDNE